MSRLVSQIQAVNTNKRYMAKYPLSSIVEIRDEITPIPCIYNTEYRIDVNVGATVTIPDNKYGDTDYDRLQYASESVKKTVIEQIFGEFRQHFCALYIALLNDDTEKALELTRSFEKQMFNAD